MPGTRPARNQATSIQELDIGTDVASLFTAAGHWQLPLITE
jgi:hypothetical protein